MGADRASLHPQPGVLSGHAAEGQVVGSPDPSALARDRIQTLEGESLTAGVLLVHPAGTMEP